MSHEQIYLISSLVTLATAVTALFVIFRRDLMMLQQNSYRNERYLRWFKQSREASSAMRLWSIVAFFALLASNIPYLVGSIVAVCVLVAQTIILAKRKYKKPLVMTKRAIRINCVMWLLAVVVTLGIALPLASWRACTCTLVALTAVSPLVLLAANLILKPVETQINRKYYNDACDRLASMPELKVIGITGSYGKTSTKHYLHRILSEHFDTLMTPGSFNTTLGVIRTIREHLKPYNEVFICEMGAKQPGDIKEICDLVHPQIGIITAVGEQHLESFNSIENVQRTKFELVDALPSDGLAVLNDDFEYVANRKVDNVRSLRYRVNRDVKGGYRATDITYDATGTTFTIVTPDGENIDLHTRLVGECNISNLIAAVIVARQLGVPDNKIKYAVEHIEQVEHRLNVKRTQGGLVIIDDAFNSNPTGSAMAMDVLKGMTGGKRIVITPGMIELGSKQFEYNEALGAKMAESCDIAIVVGKYNRDAILEGLKEKGMTSDNVYAVDTFAQAQHLLGTIARKGDTVLYENDLPDTFK